MKKMCKALALTLCTVMLLSTLTVVGDSGGKSVLTLDEAKKIALDNDTQFKLQQSYIQQESEDYEDTYDKYTKTDKTNYTSVADRAEAEISRKMAIENSAFNVRMAVFKRNNLERKSNYDVADAFYEVVKAKYGVDDAKRAMDLSKRDLDIGKIKLDQGLLTKSSYSTIENAYKSEQTAYNKALSDVQNNMATLSRNIGKNLDVFNDELDMTVTMPDVKSIDLNKVKEDYLKNSPDFYQLKEALEMAEYNLDLTQEKYDYYYERNPNKTRTIISDLNELLQRAKRDYNDAKYSLDEAEKTLDVTLNTLYTGINTLTESIDNLKKSIEDTRTTVEESRIRFDLGLISKIDMEKSESGLKDLENKLNTTTMDLNLQYTTLIQYSEIAEK